MRSLGPLALPSLSLPCADALALRMCHFLLVWFSPPFSMSMLALKTRPPLCARRWPWESAVLQCAWGFFDLASLSLFSLLLSFVRSFVAEHKGGPG